MQKAVVSNFQVGMKEGLSMGLEYNFRFIRDDLCDRCGRCLERCPVLELSGNDARQEITTLIRGNTGASLVLQQCVTCNACDFVCPQQANPYGLILAHHNKEGRAKGLPYIARFIFPNEPENMWTTTRVLMGKDELAQLSSGETPVHKHEQRAWDILAVVTNLMLKWPFYPRRFFQDPLI